MTRKRYSVEQIFAVVKLNQLGTPVPDTHKLGVVEQTVYRWKKLCGGNENIDALSIIKGGTLCA